MSNPSLSSGDWQELRRLLEDVAKLTNERGVPFGVAARSMEFLPKLSYREKALEVRRSSSPVPRGESASARHKRIVGEVRDRDRGCCAKGFLLDMGVRCRGMLHLDHFYGRGKEEETVESLWQLCARHHELKTQNRPSRIDWIEHFRRHAWKHEYLEEVAHCDRLLALEHGQHPKHLEAANG